MGLGAATYCFVICSRYGLRGVRIGEASHPGHPRLVLRGAIPSQGEVSARDVVDELPTTVPASQSPAPEEPSTAPPTFRGLADGRHEQRVFSMASSDEDADTESIPSQFSQEHDSGSENGDGASVAVELQEPDEVERVEPLQFAPVGRRVREGFASLDSVDLVSIFKRRAHVIRSVPVVIKGAYTAAMRMSMEEMLRSKRVHDVESEQRAWKLFLLLPRMLLYRPTRGGKVSKGHLMERLELITNGQWDQLIARSNQISQEVASISVRRRRREAGSDLERRAARAEKVVALGELSAGRQALEGAAIAPGTMRTLAAITDPRKRPREPRSPLDEDLLTQDPVIPYIMDMKKFLANVRSAPGPSGMTVEHLRPLLESDRDSLLFYEVVVEISRGNAPDVFWDAVRLGRVTALVKPDGGVRGIVVGDVLRRVIARTIAQEIGDAVQSATGPYQYALKTTASTECVSHVCRPSSNRMHAPLLFRSMASEHSTWSLGTRCYEG